MKHVFDPLKEVCHVCGITRLLAEEAYPDCAGARWAYDPPKRSVPMTAGKRAQV